MATRKKAIEKTKEELEAELEELRSQIAAYENYDKEYRKILEDFIRERQLYRKIVEDVPDLICRYKPDTTITFVNDVYAKYFGKSPSDLIGTSFLKLIPPEGQKYVKEKIASLTIDSPVVTMEHQVLAPSAQLRWLLWRDRAQFDESGKLLEIQSIGQDITERKRMGEALAQSEEKFRQMAENIREVFWLFDCDSQRVLYASPAYEEIWGRKLQDLYARYNEWAESVHPADREFARESFEKIFETGGGEDREYRIIRPDGTVRWISDKGYAVYDENRKVIRIAGTAEDITERKHIEEKLRELSLRDELTGLYNRRGFFTIADQLVKNAKRMKRGMLLISADLDDLKGINDTFGHHEGDLVLVETSHLLKETFRESDIVARVGGDEFVILMLEKPESSMYVFSERLRQNLENHNAERHRTYTLSLSVGFAFYDPASPSSISDLLIKADDSMYKNKRNRKKA